MRNIIFAVFILFLMVISSLMVFWGLKTLHDEESSKRWPRAIATVNQVRVVAVTGRGGITYCPEWTYEFSVNGINYSSSRTALGTVKCHGNQAMAELELNKSPVGSKISAIYNPDNPSVAVLKLSSSGSFYWLLISTGSLCIIAGLIIFGVFIKSAGRGKPIEYLGNFSNGSH